MLKEMIMKYSACSLNTAVTGNDHRSESWRVWLTNMFDLSPEEDYICGLHYQNLSYQRKQEAISENRSLILLLLYCFSSPVNI